MCISAASVLPSGRVTDSNLGGHVGFPSIGRSEDDCSNTTGVEWEFKCCTLSCFVKERDT
jgi:hypothetical protein